jgi:hypothetical protein
MTLLLECAPPSPAVLQAHPVYDRDYFIRFYEAIPQENWGRTKLIDAEGRRCALGHLGPTGLSVSPFGCFTLCSWDFENDARAGALARLFEKGGLCSVTEINDGLTFKDGKIVELSGSPKQRVLAALRKLP